MIVIPSFTVIREATAEELTADFGFVKITSDGFRGNRAVNI
jgi:hypothetical protein